MYPRMPARSSGSSTRDLGINPTSPSGATRTWWVIVAIFLIASEIRSLKNPKGRERTAPEKNTLLLGFRTVGGDLKVDPAYRRKKDLKVPIDTVLNLALDAIDVEENVEGEEENPSDADELVAASLPDLGDGCAFLQAVDEAGETSEDVLVVEEVFGDDGVGGDGWEGGRDDEWCDDVEFVPFRTLAEAWL